MEQESRFSEEATLRPASALSWCLHDARLTQKPSHLAVLATHRVQAVAVGQLVADLHPVGLEPQVLDEAREVVPATTKSRISTTKSLECLHRPKMSRFWTEWTGLLPSTHPLRP